MKNPNGYGSIIKLSGKRRNPYAVVVTVSLGKEADGKVHQRRKYIGYYASKKEALHALDVYHDQPTKAKESMTFSEVYQRWSEEKYPTISESNRRIYNTAYRDIPALHDKSFAALRPIDLQNAIDNSGKGQPMRRKIITLFSQMYKYAAFHEIVPSGTNPASLLKAGKAQKSHIHHRFTNEEIKTMWEHCEDEQVEMILMLIYSGVRPGEMFNLLSEDVHIDEQFFYVRSGKNENAVRVVPIHRKTLPFFQHWLDKKSEYLLVSKRGKQINYSRSHTDYINAYWRPVLESLGIFRGTDKILGEEFEHKPHDTRHTFATMWAEARLDEAIRRRIMGHAGKGVGEQVYTHFAIQEMIKEINKLD